MCESRLAIHPLIFVWNKTYHTRNKPLGDEVRYSGIPVYEDCWERSFCSQLLCIDGLSYEMGHLRMPLILYHF